MLRSTSRTFAPSRAKRMAAARPLPMVSPGVCPAPTTIPTLFVSLIVSLHRIMSASLLRCHPSSPFHHWRHKTRRMHGWYHDAIAVGDEFVNLLVVIRKGGPCPLAHGADTVVSFAKGVRRRAY